MSDATKTGTTTTHRGSCHCGKVRFEVDLDLAKGATRCNCSICTKLSTLGVIVQPGALRVTEGEDRVAGYLWGHRVATRYFCPSCGVHLYGRGHLAELGGDFASVNLNALDGVELSELPIAYWDGRHDAWDAGTRATPWPILRQELR